MKLKIEPYRKQPKEQIEMTHIWQVSCLNNKFMELWTCQKREIFCQSFLIFLFGFVGKFVEGGFWYFMCLFIP